MQTILLEFKGSELVVCGLLGPSNLINSSLGVLCFFD